MKPKLTVVFVVTAYPVEGQTTAGIFHQTLAEALVRLGASVEVIAPVPRYPAGVAAFRRRWRRYAAIPASYVAGGVRVLRPRYWQLPATLARNHLHRLYRRLIVADLTVEPDLLHAHFAYPCGLAALEIVETASFPKVPTLLTLHGSDVNDFPRESARARRLFKRAVTGADAVVAVSNALADRTESISGRRPIVLPIGLNLAAYGDLPEDKPLLRRSLGLPSDRRLALFIGALQAEKGVRELLSAYRELSERDGVTGVVIGEGPLRRAVERSDAAIWLGTVSNDRVPLYLRAVDVFVLPSHKEGMPTVLIEAGAAGTPVVATSVGGIPELLDEGRGLLIRPESAEEIVSGVRQILADPAGSAKRAQALRNYICAHYDVDANARRLLELYQELL